MTRLSTVSKRKAIVIGGSVGGLFAANLLVRAGWSVEVLERTATDLAARGTGVARHPKLEYILEQAGADISGGIGISVPGRQAYDNDGNKTEFCAFPQTLGAWNRVYGSLKSAFSTVHYHNGQEVVDLWNEVDGVTAVTASGQRFSADIAIAADGFLSAIRKRFAPDVEPQYSNYVAWRGISNGSDLPESFRSDAFSQYAFLFPRGGHYIGYPMEGSGGSIEPEHRRYNFLWYHPAPAAELADILTGIDGHQYHYSIPPPQLRQEHVDGLKALADRLLPELFRPTVHCAESIMVQPIYDLESRSMVFGRVVLLGDAAFVARPHVGVGILKAAGDAFELSESLKSEVSIDDALGRYNARRVARGRAIVEQGRVLGAYIERGLPDPLADPSLGLTIERLITESGRPLKEDQ